MPAYKGLSILEARERAVEDLKAQGLIEKIEEIDHSVGHCYRCHTVVEPIFLNSGSLKPSH